VNQIIARVGFDRRSVYSVLSSRHVFSPSLCPPNARRRAALLGTDGSLLTEMAWMQSARCWLAGHPAELDGYCCWNVTDATKGHLSGKFARIVPRRVQIAAESDVLTCSLMVDILISYPSTVAPAQ
jgi:hypothetical protein